MNGLRELGDNHSMDIKNLIAKICFLLSTCGLLRPDDLALKDASQCKVRSDKLELIVSKLFVEYRRRTMSQDRFARRSHPKMETEFYAPLIRDVRRGNLGLSGQRISKYIEMIMSHMPRDEGQPRYKARAVGATTALQKGIPMDDVTTHGNWSSPAIVEAFYRISRFLSNNFTTAIFS
ncbi:hypothetical protein EC991_000506 [Linnemannia zychae]|nr:hypothetical protein EC991_000506 [Linnemannia zychae]